MSHGLGGFGDRGQANPSRVTSTNAIRGQPSFSPAHHRIVADAAIDLIQKGPIP